MKEKKKIYELHAEICKVLANSKRLEVINLLRDGELSVDELTTEMGIRKANLSQHLSLMRQRKILKTRREGKKVFYRLSNPKVVKACDIMREVLLEKLKENQKLVKKMKDGSFGK